MGYVWLFLGAFAVMCVVTLAMAGLVRYVAKSFPLSSPVFPTGGIVLTAAYLFASMPLWIDRDLTCPLIGFLALCGLLLLQLKVQGILRELGFLAICIASVLMLPTNLPLFRILGSFGGYSILSVSLYVMMRLFIIMDRVPWFSNLTLLAQGMLILFLIKMGIFPGYVGYPLLYAFVATIAVAQSVKVYFGQPVLGEFASLVAGFVLGYIWTVVIADGHWGVPPVLYSYSAVEVLISWGCSCFIARRFCRLDAPFFIEQAMSTGLNTKRLIRALFFLLVFLSFLSLANLGREIWVSVLVLLGATLLAACYQFKRWSVPRVRLRDLGSDLKQGFTELKKEMMTLPLKKKSSKNKRRKK